MAGVLLHPLRRKAGTFFLLTGLNVLLVNSLLKRVQGIRSRSVPILHCSSQAEVECHYFVSFLFFRNDRTSNNSLESTVFHYQERETFHYFTKIFAGLF